MATAREEYIVDSSGKKKAVILSIEQYERILQDIHDLNLIADARSEPSSSLEEVEARLRKDGILPG